ncbi:MAG: DUF533 domain-containing protein [Burkholderiaceae bacterium]
MNLVGTLAKVAVGAMVARGVGKMMGGSGSSGGGLGGLLGGALGGGGQSDGGSGGSGGLGGLLGGALGGGANQSAGGLGGLLSGALGGDSQQQGGGGLGGLLGGLTGGGAQQDAGGGLGGLLGSVLAGGGAAGGLGGLLNSLGGGGQQQDASGGLGGLLNQALGGQATPEPTPDQNSQAEIMLRAMINAAKSDGQIDQEEQAKILEHLGDVTQEEIDFVRNEMAQPLDLDGFVRSVPNGMQQQVYAMSLLGIKLDSQAEAQYLDRLAQSMGISNSDVNAIHAQIGVPNLYS